MEVGAAVNVAGYIAYSDVGATGGNGAQDRWVGVSSGWYGNHVRAKPWVRQTTRLHWIEYWSTILIKYTLKYIPLLAKALNSTHG